MIFCTKRLLTKHVMALPAAVVLLCGKRKSGKDYIASRLQEMFDDTLSVVRLSKPLKEQYAKEHDLDLVRLMDSSCYKETYRQDMIIWGERIRNKDPDYFCQLSTIGANKPVWLVCDARRPTDMTYFKTMFNGRTLCVRVVASEDVRVERGWAFTQGVDDAPSECALDGYDVDLTVTNNGGEEFSEGLEKIRTWVTDRTKQD